MSLLTSTGVSLLAILLSNPSAVGSDLFSDSSLPVQSITLDQHAKPIGRWLGSGIEFDPYVKKPDAARWATMLERVVYSRPGFLRVMSGASDYCSGFDATGAPIYRWITDPRAPQLERVFEILDFAQAHGIQVYLGAWSPPGNLGIHSPDDPRWAVMIAAFVDYLVREKHYTVVHHYILMNEPNGQWMWRGRTPDFGAWATGVRQLRQELDKRKLQQVVLTGPDNSGDRAWFDRSVLELNSLFGAWEQHIYATDDEVSSGHIERDLIADGKTILAKDPNGANKPRFIAESGLVTGKIEALDQQPRVHDFDYGVRMSDYVVQIARAGWMGADAWDLDDAMHSNGHGGQKIWGFWDSSSAEGMKPRPWFYTWSLLSRYLPSGAEIMPLPGTADGRVRATAARWVADRTQQWTVVLVNDADSPADVSMDLPNMPQLAIYRYFADEQQTDAKGFPKPVAMKKLPAGQVIHLPSHGVVLMTSAKD